MKQLIFVLFIFSSIIAISQSDRGTSNIGDGFTSKKGAIKGHPYQFQNWEKGYLLDANGTLSEEKLLNYDILNNQLTFKDDASGEVLVIDSNDYSGFMVSDSKNENYNFSKIKGSVFKKQQKVDKYYQLVDGNSKLVILESSKQLKDPNASGWSSSSLSTKSAEYVLSTNIYILDNSNTYIKVKASKPSILKALKNKKTAIEKYIRDNNLSIKSESDLVPILKFYHSL
jgi:hypothetical protein